VELTLLPGMGEPDTGGVDTGVRFTIVEARVGSKVGEVKVQQFCLQVTTDTSTAPGRLALVPSNNSLGCGGQTFIGAVVKDSKGQVPLDDKVTVNWLASSGNFLEGSTFRPNLSVKPVNGALNVTYRADPGTNGEVTISAAAGATFGSTTIIVNCPFGASAAGTNVAFSGAFGSGTPPGSQFLRPPSTGESGTGLIRPPSTGNAGLASE
jgi:hypothetical protein